VVLEGGDLLRIDVAVGHDPPVRRDHRDARSRLPREPSEPLRVHAPGEQGGLEVRRDRRRACFEIATGPLGDGPVEDPAEEGGEEPAEEEARREGDERSPEEALHRANL
jgi:hypothetical protein